MTNKIIGVHSLIMSIEISGIIIMKIMFVNVFVSYMGYMGISLKY